METRLFPFSRPVTDGPWASPMKLLETVLIGAIPITAAHSMPILLTNL